MENLLPLAAYDVEETGYWARLPFLSGLLYGLLTVIIDVVYARADAVPPFSGVPGALFTLVALGFFSLGSCGRRSRPLDAVCSPGTVGS